MASAEDTAAGAPTTDDNINYQEKDVGDVLGQVADDPDSSQTNPDFTTSKQVKDEAEAEKKQSSEGTQNLKTTFIISGVAIAVIGALVAIAKKIKEA